VLCDVKSERSAYVLYEVVNKVKERLAYIPYEVIDKVKEHAL
jgi:hypothetical protein